jgi:hypothetical protein
VLDHRVTIPDQECIRILLVDLDTMPRQLIQHDLEHERGITLVEAQPGVPIAAAVGRADADVVLTGRDDPAAAAAILVEHPLVRLLAVVGDSRDLLLYELRPRRRKLGEFSKEHLLRALRGVRKPRSDWLP